MMTWVPSLQFLPQLLEDRFAFSDQRIFYFLAALGLLWSASNGFLSRFTPLFSPRVLFRLLLLLACFLTFAAVLPIPSFFVTAFLITNICAALTWTYLFVGISNQASLAIQGEVLGVSQAIGSIAVLTGLGLKRYLTALFPDQYYIFAAAIIFLAAIAASLSRTKRTT